MVEVVIAIIVIILLLVVLHFNITRIDGGYIIPDSFTKAADSEIHDKASALKAYEKLKDGEMDKFCKCICYYFFYKAGVSPTRIPYIGGSMLSSLNDIRPYLKRRFEPKLSKIFIPDFAICHDTRLLIVEFDEGNKYHQNNSNQRYVMKNYIYDEILCNETEYKVTVLRIKYNNAVTNATKPMAMRLIVSIILFVYEHVRTTFAYKYVLAALDITNKDVALTELVSVETTVDRSTFTPTNPIFSCFDLDSRKLLPGFEDIRNETDIETVDRIKLFKEKLFDNYEGSKYDAFIANETKNNTAIDRIANGFKDMKLIIRHVN